MATHTRWDRLGKERHPAWAFLQRGLEGSLFVKRGTKAFLDTLSHLSP